MSPRGRDAGGGGWRADGRAGGAAADAQEAWIILASGLGVAAVAIFAAWGIAWVGRLGVG